MVSINRFVQRPERIVLEVFDSNQRNCIALCLSWLTFRVCSELGVASLLRPRENFNDYRVGNLRRCDKEVHRDLG